MSFDLIVNTLAAMDPGPRRQRWTSLSYCVLDAVWSISSRYETVVAPLVRRVAKRNGDLQPLIGADAPLPPDPLPLPALLACYPTAQALRQDTNGQRTSARSGIEKAEAALSYAEILADHDIPDLAAAAALVPGSTAWNAVNAALAEVRGEGLHGVRRGYLWMLCGFDHVTKPDRMIVRWLNRHGCACTEDGARELLDRVAAELTVRLGRPVTPWMVDRAIWKAESTRPALGSTTTIRVEVAGWPPIKNEAVSLFAARHPHRERVERLLAAAAAEVASTGWATVTGDVLLDVTVRSPERPPGDATNFLGGIADVLQGRQVAAVLDLSHLGELAGTALFADDRQIQQVSYQAVEGPEPSYAVQVTAL